MRSPTTHLLISDCNCLTISTSVLWFDSDCQFSLLLPIYMSWQTAFPLTIYIFWLASAKQQSDYINPWLEISTFWPSGTWPQKFSFIYLLNFFFPTCGQWVVSLKFSLLDFIVVIKPWSLQAQLKLFTACLTP